MSSREIAELTGKRHDNVRRDIHTLLEQLGEDSLKFEEKVATGGRPILNYHLPKDLTITLVAGYSAPLRHRIVTRWMKLEAQAAKPPAPTAT